ncbi:MAG: hypothetical protein H7235_01030, partial [Bdellovibrionaceae bacterium]|nr:hypothetical protein [Pseudobdellovibrionaceae bacterium]
MRIFHSGFSFVFALILSGYAYAANTAAENNVTQKRPTATNSATSSLVLGFKSWEDSGRAAYLNDDDARVMKSKSEFYLGYRDQSGWGGYGQAVQYFNSYKNNGEKTKWSAGDASVTLLHPDWYQSPTVTLFGQFRYYIPTTERSVEKTIQQYAYYFRANIVLAPGHELFNEIIPRYFDAKIYDIGDTTSYVEDTTVYNYKLNKNWKVGVKSWAQYEYHVTDAAGFCLEVGPQLVY